MSKQRYNVNESVSNMAGERADEWKSFWVPQLAASAEDSQIEKPVNFFFFETFFSYKLINIFSLKKSFVH